MRTVGVGAKKKEDAAYLALRKEIEGLKKENKQLKAENKKFKKEIGIEEQPDSKE